jgi:hypothetical protein
LTKKETGMNVTRRNHLATMGALLAASSLSSSAKAHGPDDGDADVLYGHGMVWNRELPGVAGEVKLAFDLRVNLKTGAGFGTATDPVYPDWNVHFAIDSTDRERLRKGETRYTMRGVVTQANSPASVGLPVRILAETRGETTAIAIALGDLAFGGAGLVVNAIIGVLIGLLLPSVLKVR